MISAIRSATPEDLPAIMAIERSTPELPHWPLPAYERYVCWPAQSDRVLFVAEVSSVVVGFAAAALAVPEGRVAELESIVVLPKVRRSGVGTELCRRMMDWSRNRADTLELEVRSRSAHAIALYKSLGFCVLRARPQYYANPADDALVMSLDL